ncbi:MAG: glycosyltransferase [Phenylobacterium sp.]|uniref:glycosyltransferase n=1 Tax=Phenylobacterium sp. TaxID=1871053 RepID=UPI001A5C0BB9|nr:glycosyltransferase [Phenylobacterium sp.]MBL8771283.1 glycosyltransferase [Phenylobacterium sp.]
MSSTGPIVLFLGRLAGDGVARNAVHLANALVQRGLAVQVVCLQPGPLAEDLRGAGLTCLGWARGPRGLALAAATGALRRELQALRPSVVVSMGNHGHLAVWAALRGLPDVPRIYRISNDPAHAGADPLRRAAREAGLRLVAADATRLVCVSAALARGPAFRRARRDRRIDVLSNGVDVEAIRRRATAPVRHPWVDDGRPYVVAVGRLHPQKNYPRLLDALRLARESRPELRLLVLGGGPDKARAALEAQARGAGVADAVRFEGEVADPFPLVARASAYVLASRWEGASNSLLEALACGVPVVASRSAGAAPDVLGHGRFGVLVDPDSPSDLARGLLAQTDPATRILPGGRAGDFPLDANLARLCAVVAGARRLHDEIQMLVEGQSHGPALSAVIPQRSTEC